MSPRAPSLVLPIAVLAPLALATPALAAFPGRNGRIAVSFSNLNEPDYATRFTYDRAIRLLSGDRGPDQAVTEVAGCHEVTDSAPPLHEFRGDCSLTYRDPAVSPDGRRIAFDAGARIAVIGVDGTGLRTLAAAGPDPGHPAWSPGGGRILFDSPRDATGRSRSDLYVVPAAGTGGPVRLVRDAANPSWSSRALLAFERSDAVWVARSSGARAHRVSRRGASAPDFSPAGRRVVFATRRGRLEVVGVNGRGRRRLAAVTVDAETPVWSPDGRRLAWGSFDSPVYVGRADGSHPHAISLAGVGAGYGFASASPSWQPLR